MCVGACVCTCVRAWVCVCACVCACVRVCVCAFWPCHCVFSLYKVGTADVQVIWESVALEDFRPLLNLSNRLIIDWAVGSVLLTWGSGYRLARKPGLSSAIQMNRHQNVPRSPSKTFLWMTLSQALWLWPSWIESVDKLNRICVQQ